MYFIIVCIRLYFSGKKSDTQFQEQEQEQEQQRTNGNYIFTISHFVKIPCGLNFRKLFTHNNNIIIHKKKAKTKVSS